MILRMNQRLVILNKASEISIHLAFLTKVWNFSFRITFTELVVLHVVTKAKEVHYCSYYHKNCGFSFT
jgi:hypothetical protein